MIWRKNKKDHVYCLWSHPKLAPNALDEVDILIICLVFYVSVLSFITWIETPYAWIYIYLLTSPQSYRLPHLKFIQLLSPPRFSSQIERLDKRERESSLKLMRLDWSVRNYLATPSPSVIKTFCLFGFTRLFAFVSFKRAKDNRVNARFHLTAQGRMGL